MMAFNWMLLPFFSLDDFMGTNPILAPLVAHTVKRLSTMWETRVRSLGQGRFPGERNGNPLQYSCLENLMDTGAWWVAVHGITKGQA